MVQEVSCVFLHFVQNWNYINRYKHWNNNIQKIITQTLSSLCISDPLLFLLSVADWWLFYCYRYFIPLWESQNVHSHYQKCHIFWFGMPARHLKYRTDTRTGPFKTHKIRTVSESKEEWVPEGLLWKKSSEDSRSLPEHDCWLPSSAKFKMSGTVLPLPLYLHGLLRDSFIFYGGRGCETCCCTVCFKIWDWHTFSVDFLAAC
jgi:hypothetical protein